MHRVGVIPFETKKELTAILFVTSQTRGRWILPKGKPKKSETHVQACLREGFEEAGVRGIVLENFPMTMLITSRASDGMSQFPVTYYPLLVTEQVDDWPEVASRQRHWALLEDAPRVAYREDFHPLLHQFELLMPWVREAAAPYKPAPQEAPMPVR